MRLTLRTLLAYLDGVLEDPMQARELATKIQESRFAGELVQRIKSVVERGRLGAPPILGSGPQDDPNVVAEYLQSSLPHDEVPSFEKACLDSDVQLAEVAACHRILCELLNEREPTKISPGLRERLVRLPLEMDPEAARDATAKLGPTPTGSQASRDVQNGTQTTARSAGNGESAGEAADVGKALRAEQERGVDPDSGLALPFGLEDVSSASLLEGLNESGATLTEGAKLTAEASLRQRVSRAKPSRKQTLRPLSWQSIAVTSLLGFVVALVAMRALGEFNSSHVMIRWFAGSPRAQRDIASTQPGQGQASVAKQVGAGSAALEPRGSSASPVDLAVPSDQAASALHEAASGTGRQPASSGSPSSRGVVGGAGRVPASSETAGTDGKSSESLAAASLTSPSTMMPSAPGEPLEFKGVETQPGGSAAEPARTEVANSGAVSAETAGPRVAGEMPAGVVPPTRATMPAGTEPTTVATELVIEEGVPVGRYSSESQVLARWQTLSASSEARAAGGSEAVRASSPTADVTVSTDEMAWVPLAEDATLSAGNLLLSLPSYRPQLVLTPGVKLTLVHDALVKLLPAVGETTPRIDLRRGRVILLPVVMSPMSIRCVLGYQEGTLSFSNLESAAAVEVRQLLPIGSDPEITPIQVVARLSCTQGQITWKVSNEPPLVLDAGTQVTAINRNPFSLVESASPPAWLDPMTDSELEIRAATELRKALIPGRPLTLSLLEKTNFRQQEVVDLASRALATMDSPKELIERLSDPRQSSFWANQVVTLQQLVERGPESARIVRLAFEELHGELAPILYRLTWGFSPEQLASSGASDLVAFLDSNDMALRVLAFKTLEQITGMNHLFRPELPPDQEKSKIARWQRALAEGRVVYRETAP
jgi:hypothetical protein